MKNEHMKHGGPESGRQDDEKQPGDPKPEGDDTSAQEPKANDAE